MIYAKLHGRLGNIMFIAATAASLAARRDDKFCLVCHRDYFVEDGKYMWDYIQKFKSNILNGIEIIPEIPQGVPIVKQEGCYYTELSLDSEDFMIDGAFQSYKYFDNSVVHKIFNVDSVISEILHLNAEAFALPITSVHIRRGDYCTMPHKLPPVSRSYIKRAMKMFPQNSRFLIIGDDLDYCRRNFKGDNIFFMNGSTVLRDIFAPTLCENNIISNSTFGWWGGYLNSNPTKKVVVPTPWFGKYARNSESNVADLIPNQWIQIENRLDFDLWVKAKKLGCLTRLGIIK